LNEDDHHGHFDPLWYDRVEPDAPPGLLLNAAAYVFLMLLAGIAGAAWLYWIPDRVWCWASERIQRRRATSD
jgi:hypothetical protein